MFIQGPRSFQFPKAPSLSHSIKDLFFFLVTLILFVQRESHVYTSIPILSRRFRIAILLSDRSTQHGQNRIANPYHERFASGSGFRFHWYWQILLVVKMTSFSFLSSSSSVPLVLGSFDGKNKITETKTYRSSEEYISSLESKLKSIQSNSGFSGVKGGIFKGKTINGTHSFEKSHFETEVKNEGESLLGDQETSDGIILVGRKSKTGKYSCENENFEKKEYQLCCCLSVAIFLGLIPAPNHHGNESCLELG